MYEYSCPDCGTTNQLHPQWCAFETADWYDIEKAYIDILSVVMMRASTGAPVDFSALQTDIDGDWTAIHDEVYDNLLFQCRIHETDDGRLVPVDPERRKELLEPSSQPIQRIWETGSIPGCHDNSVFALISWHESHGFSWAETKDRLLTWFEQTGTWSRGGFEESSPEQLIESKKHVYDSGYGWFDKAQAAKQVIDAGTQKSAN